MPLTSGTLTRVIGQGNEIRFVVTDAHDATIEQEFQASSQAQRDLIRSAVSRPSGSQVEVESSDTGTVSRITVSL